MAVLYVEIHYPDVFGAIGKNAIHNAFGEKGVIIGTFATEEQEEEFQSGGTTMVVYDAAIDASIRRLIQNRRAYADINNDQKLKCGQPHRPVSSSTKGNNSHHMLDDPPSVHRTNACLRLSRKKRFLNESDYYDGTGDNNDAENPSINNVPKNLSLCEDIYSGGVGSNKKRQKTEKKNAAQVQLNENIILAMRESAALIVEDRKQARLEQIEERREERREIASYKLQMQESRNEALRLELQVLQARARLMMPNDGNPTSNQG
jgi:hypothetical protein